ncbi:hypothetical protein A3C37_00205 [Candidatus Peribacteria bacterium RIFCSPHIGHO2_02_FULL_53_20]|nr:MAG: hypothetical protein A3C37_00205 [Candidatus Peribacteria bacterium RIFCSPHIGHO2_02_FULL_53_20]
MPSALLRHRFGIGSVMVAVVLVSAVLSEVVRYSSDKQVAQVAMGGDVSADVSGAVAGGPAAGGTMGGGSSIPGGNMGGIAGDPGGDIGGIGGGSSTGQASSADESSSAGGLGGNNGGFSSFGGLGGDIGAIGGQSSQGNNSSSTGQQSSSVVAQSSSAANSSSAAPPSSSAPRSSSAGGISSSPSSSSPPASSAPPPRCGDAKVDFGESCDPCAPPGRPTTDANCTALCSPARCGDGFIDRRRGEECDYVGLNVDEAQSPFVTRDETTFARCISDSACSGGYCLYSHCWSLRWLAYWGWTDSALCPQNWTRMTAEGGTTESIGAPCNDFANPRCREFLGDGCAISCKLERCGDQIVQVGYTTAQGRHYGLTEECDDGNIFPGDGCSDRCTFERASSSATSSIPTYSAASSLGFCDQFPHLCAANSSLQGFTFDYSAPARLSSAPSYNAPPPPPASSAPAAVAMRIPACGDGQLDPGEECDHASGNSDTVSGACRLQCRNASCGDFVADYTLGEQCDQGVGNSATEANRCRPDCSLPRCGDQVVDRGETCDDGNPLPGDGCTSFCTWETIDAIQPQCGDRRIQGGEQCDDGNLMGGDGCSAACQAEFVLGALEQLDPVLVAGGVVCGDGVLLDPEECDDGNPDPGDGCSPLCTNELPVCGNGILETAEQCDDGNLFDTDGCNAQCQVVAPPKPAAPPLVAQVIPLPEPPTYTYIPVRAPIGDTGPAAIAVMASGAAAGVGWMRRRRKKVA